MRHPLATVLFMHDTPRVIWYVGLLAVSAFLAGAALLFVELLRAPIGTEDDEGFHEIVVAGRRRNDRRARMGFHL